MGDFYRCILCDVTYPSENNASHVLGAQHERLAAACTSQIPRFIFKTSGPATPMTLNKQPRNIGSLWFEYDKHMLEQGDIPDRIYDPCVGKFHASYNDDAPSEPLRDTPNDGDLSGWGENVWDNNQQTQESVDVARAEAKSAHERDEAAELEILLAQTKLEQEEIEIEQARIQLSYVESLESTFKEIKHEISPFDDSDYDYDSEDFDESSSD